MNFKMTTYSREYLSTYKQNYQTINLCNQIEQQILQKALRGENRLVYTMSNKYPIGNGQFIEADHVVNMLKTRFPDSHIEYQEVKNIHGKLESGIVIDWS